jgi:hypothetical protein
MSAPIRVALALSLLLAAGCTAGDDGGGGAPARTFWSWDLSVMPPADKEVPATRRGETEHFHLYVEDELWETEVTQAQLDDLAITLEDATPAGSIDTNAGIVDNDVATFGPIPDAIDGDPKVFLLLMNIEGFQSFEFDGFFRALDQEPDGSDPNYRSNEVEMLFVNAEIRNVDSETTKSVIAHELVHLLEWGQDPVEDGWLSETFGELGMTINGYFTDENWVEDYLATPEEPLYGGPNSVHYGACLLFGNYLYERFGGSFVSDLVALTSDGPASITNALAAAGETVTYEDVFLDWIAANVADAPDEASGLYGYQFAELEPAAPWTLVTSTADSATASILVNDSAVRYIRFDPATPYAYLVTVTTNVSAFGRLVLVRRVSTDPTTVDVSFPAIDPSNTTQVVVNLVNDGPYDEAYLALVSMGGNTTFGASWIEE